MRSYRQPNLAAALARISQSATGVILTLSFTVPAFPAWGDTVNFWLSNSATGPVAPAIDVPAGALSAITVWARPPAGKTLRAFSLNLESTDAPALDFAQVRVPNPEGPEDVFRHDLVFDSLTDLYDGYTFNDFFLHDQSIEGFMGLTFFAGAPGLMNGSGIGNDCQETQYCEVVSGEPAWRIASVTFRAGDAETSTELYLGIGTQGIWLTEDEEPTDTQAVFGEPCMNCDDVHSWPGSGSDPLGLPDAVINVVATDADFDDDGDVDGRDYLIWQSGYNVGTMHSEGDADGNDAVDAADLAVWQDQYDAYSTVVKVVPESGSLVLVWWVLCFGVVSRKGRAFKA